MAAETEAEPLVAPPTSLHVVVPDYEIEVHEGIDLVTIPGAGTYQEPDKPVIPRYSVHVDLPVGYRVQQVSVTGTSAPVTLEWARSVLPKTTGSFIEHRDGFHTAIFLTGIQDFNYAGMRADTGEIVSCQMMLPMPGHGATTADFFNPLSRHVEDMVLSGKTIYPVERTLLTSGMVIGGVDSITAANTRVDTPEMGVVYQGPEASMFWRS